MPIVLGSNRARMGWSGRVNAVAPQPSIDDTPLVSVLLPIWNGERWIRDALASLHAQTFRDFEIVVIDDLGTDRSLDIVREMQIPNLRVVLGPGEGLAAALEAGIQASRGELLARQDQDDLSSPDRLARQVHFMDEHPACVAYGSCAWLVNDDGQRIGRINVPLRDRAIRLRMLLYNPMIHTSVMMRRRAVIEAGGYRSPSREPYPEDFDLWVRLAQIGQFANCKQPLVSYRRPTGSTLTSSGGSAICHSAGQIAAGAFQSALGLTQLSLHDWELLSMFNDRHRRISVREAIRTEILLMRVAFRHPHVMLGGWPWRTYVQPAMWVVRTPKHVSRV